MIEEWLSENAVPYERLMQSETKRIVYNFCTLFSLLENKKMSIGSIFLQLIDDKEYQKILLKMLSEENITEALKTFLLIEPSILSNRFIKTIIKTWK